MLLLLPLKSWDYSHIPGWVKNFNRKKMLNLDSETLELLPKGNDSHTLQVDKNKWFSKQKLNLWPVLARCLRIVESLSWKMFFTFICMCLSTRAPCSRSLQRPEVGIRSHRIGVIGGFELPCGCWELSLGSLQGQQVLLTAEHLSRPTILVLIEETTTRF